MNIHEAQQIFDGTMLGDAQLARSHDYGNAYFDIAQSGTEHMDWLEVIADAFRTVGIEPCNGHPAIGDSVSHGKPYIYCRLSTKVDESLTEEYRRWYPNGIKIVPPDVLITPLSLAHWFMGDGSAFISTKVVRGYISDSVGLALSPAAFSIDDVIILERGLMKLGITKLRRQRDLRVQTGSGLNLITQSKAEINRFIDVVEPFIVDSFKYKCVHPQYKVNFRRKR